MKLLQRILKQTLKHKYAINAKLLGDSSECAWSNLGFWQGGESYPQACQNLAEHLAQKLKLTSEDYFLDLGVGYGASLLYWQKKYQIKNLQAVELQENCINVIKNKNFSQIQIFQESYLNLKKIKFKNKFDVIVCIDSAYHHNLNSFLASVVSVLNSKGRIGFHTVILSESWNTLNFMQKAKYACLLRLADIRLNNLNSKVTLESMLGHFEFKNMDIEDISESVLLGFSNYIMNAHLANQQGMDLFKIRMTAYLCKKLFDDGLIRYVQVTATYQ